MLNKKFQKLILSIFKNIKLKDFGKYDELFRLLVHRGPYNEIESERLDKLKNLYSNFKEVDGKNVIVSAHNSVIKCGMFTNQKNCSNNLELEEGGFYVIKNTNDGLQLKHEFHNFNDFNRVFYER